jgi:hypothetical protein
MKAFGPRAGRAEEHPNTVSPEVLSRSVPLRPLGILRHRRFVFLSSADVPKREVPYSIDFACFKKYLDRASAVMVNSPMLARHLDHPPRSKSFPCILLQPLCALFSSAALSFQSLAASFRKTPGVGVPVNIHPFLSTTSRLFFGASCNDSTGLQPLGFNLGFRPVLCAPVVSPICSPFVFMILRIAFPATPFFSQPSALPGGVPSATSVLRPQRLCVALFLHLLCKNWSWSKDMQLRWRARLPCATLRQPFLICLPSGRCLFLVR